MWLPGRTRPYRFDVCKSLIHYDSFIHLQVAIFLEVSQDSLLFPLSNRRAFVNFTAGVRWLWTCELHKRELDDVQVTKQWCKFDNASWPFIGATLLDCELSDSNMCKKPKREKTWRWKTKVQGRLRCFDSCSIFLWEALCRIELNSKRRLAQWVSRIVDLKQCVRIPQISEPAWWPKSKRLFAFFYGKCQADKPKRCFALFRSRLIRWDPSMGSKCPFWHWLLKYHGRCSLLSKRCR